MVGSSVHCGLMKCRISWKTITSACHLLTVNLLEKYLNTLLIDETKSLLERQSTRQNTGVHFTLYLWLFIRLVHKTVHGNKESIHRLLDIDVLNCSKWLWWWVTIIKHYLTTFMDVTRIARRCDNPVFNIKPFRLLVTIYDGLPVERFVNLRWSD
jgi:hypothetical protein